MRTKLDSALAPLKRTFGSFSAAQKALSIAAVLALVVGGFLVFRWATAPSYAPLFTNIAPEDASAVVEKLEADGIPYELSGGGGTILVPREQVYDTRIKMSGEGLPGEESTGYSILDNQDLSTSQFQEETGYKRAMEGELNKTIGAIDGVDTAVVHLALPKEEVFADEQKPTTASVLIDTKPGATIKSEQVQAVVHLVSSSIEGLDTDQVTVADSTGRVLSAAGEEFDNLADTRSQQVESFESRMTKAVQGMLEPVIGSANSAVQVTADLSFDQTRTDTTRYFADPNALPLSDTETTEKYTGGGAGGAGGVVGPDGGLTGGTGATGGDGSYEKKQRTSDNAVGKSVEKRQAAPGSVKSLHVGIVLDTRALGARDAGQVQDLVTSSLGIDAKRGDTVDVSVMPFDRSAEKEAAKEIAAAKAAEKRDDLESMLRVAAFVLLGASILFAAWLRSRKRQRARQDATTYVVEQLRQDALERKEPPALESAAGNALDATTVIPALPSNGTGARSEIAALIDRQPEEVAQLLRGWLVDHGE